MEIKFKKEDRILVVSPHQDDESIGCGGLLALFGKQTDILLLTDGRKGLSKKYNNENELVEIRNKELDEAMKIANVNSIFKLNIKNNEIKNNINIINQFDITNYSYIFVPNSLETQDDHKIVLKIFKRMKRKQKSEARLIEYEVWTPLTTPTWFLDISDVIDVKKRMIQKYLSQHEDRDYTNYAIGLSKYRGMFIKKEYAEAYRDSIYNGFKVKIYELLPNHFKEIIKRIIKNEN